MAATLAAVCFWKSADWPWFLIIGPVFLYLRLWLNMLDGMVALASGKASRRGEIFNEVPDRVSDVIVFVGVAHSGFCHPLSAYWAAIFALLTAYVGMLGQAVGVHREFSGIMSKPWRMVGLHAGAWISFAFLNWRGDRIQVGDLTVLDWTNLMIVLGCLQTIWIRLSRILGELSKNGTARNPRG
jgi:phosphatidylglycerophosphate synthase